jgi:hypothetical protein
MPNACHAGFLLARTGRRLGQHGVWWHPYVPHSGAEARGAGHLLFGSLSLLLPLVKDDLETPSSEALLTARGCQ